MEYRKKHGICYVSLGGAFPAGAVPVRHPSAPLVILIRRDPLYSRGFWAIDDLGQLTEPEGPAALLPQPTPADAPQDLQDFVKGHGAAVLNTAFPRGYEFAETWFAPRPTRLRLTLVGLGDVGGTVLTALKLLGREIESIQIFDYNENLCRRYLLELDAKKPVVLCGDMNVAHNEIDLKNPGPNRGAAGFSDQERGKMTELLAAGFTDTFRCLHPDATGAYSWWSMRFKARERNAGWRIDYFIVSDRVADRIREASILPDIYGSDHCPVLLDIDL